MKKIAEFMKIHKAFSFFLFLVAIVFMVAIFAPLIATHSPYEANMKNGLQPPSKEHIFGTDKLGRDLFSRVIYGTRTSLQAALILVIVTFSIGTILGMIAGYFGGIIDGVIMRISDMMISFPGMVLAIAVAGMLGASMLNAILALAIVSWTKYARLARSLVLKIKNQDYIIAAMVTGTRAKDILRRHILPNALPMLVVTAAMDIGTMMLELAGLSFLGFGAQSPTAEWGLMINEGRIYIQNAPWLISYPGLGILITVVVFNLFGDSLRDVLDSRSQS